MNVTSLIVCENVYIGPIVNRSRSPFPPPAIRFFELARTSAMTQLVVRNDRTLVLFPGLVPERASKMAAHGAEAGGQVRQV